MDIRCYWYCVPCTAPVEAPSPCLSCGAVPPPHPEETVRLVPRAGAVRPPLS